MSTQAIVKPEPKSIEYTPFGTDAKVKLSVKIVQDLICIPTKSGKICSERDAIRFMMLCQARALNPFEGDVYLQGYDSKDGPVFSLITAHQAFLKRAEVHPEYDGMESGVVVLDNEGKEIERKGDFYRDDDTLIGAWARVDFKNRKTPMYKKLRLQTFRKGYGVWENNPEGMIVKCAEADAFRSSFPTKLGGLYLAEELLKEPSRRFDNAREVTNASVSMLESSQPETRVIDTQLQPAADAPATHLSEQEKLFQFAESEGFTRLEFCQWARSDGHIKTIPENFSDFPEDIAKRLNKAQTGLVNKLKEFKSEVAG